jgi:hypothetical protein
MFLWRYLAGIQLVIQFHNGQENTSPTSPKYYDSILDVFFLLRASIRLTLRIIPIIPMDWAAEIFPP